MALTLLTANNAQTVLAAGISASATTLTVNTGTGSLFPSPVSGTSYFKLTLIDATTGQLTEIVHVTARTGDTMTISRAQEGTTARAWSANDIAANMLTAGTIALLAPLDSPVLTGKPTAPTAAAGTNTTQLATTAFVQAAINILAPTGSLSSGIIRLPMYNGSTVETLILQWMPAPALAAGGNTTITFPTAFPNALLSLMATGGATAAGVPGINTFSIGATSCRIYNQSTSASTQAGAIWALGK